MNRGECDGLGPAAVRPANCERADTALFTFFDGVEAAISAAHDYAGDRVIDVATGEIGGQALRLGLIHLVVVHLVPVVLRPGRPFFATGPPADPIRSTTPRRSSAGTA
jgi:dihydrofolate reductase